MVPREAGQLEHIRIHQSELLLGVHHLSMFLPQLTELPVRGDLTRSNSSPSLLHNPTQVMSPNLVAGGASTAPLPSSGMETDAGVQAILQQWDEERTEHGAQTWPLASNVKLETWSQLFIF